MPLAGTWLMLTVHLSVRRSCFMRVDISLALSIAAEASFGSREVLCGGKGGGYPSICVIRESASWDLSSSLWKEAAQYLWDSRVANLMPLQVKTALMEFPFCLDLWVLFRSPDMDCYWWITDEEGPLVSSVFLSEWLLVNISCSKASFHSQSFLSAVLNQWPPLSILT